MQNCSINKSLYKDMEIGLFYLKWSMFHLMGQLIRQDVYAIVVYIYKDYHKLKMIKWMDVTS